MKEGVLLKMTNENSIGNELVPILEMWALERTPRDTEYSEVWEESVSTTMKKKEKMCGSKLWCGL